jgi:hypothetical protein
MVQAFIPITFGLMAFSMAVNASPVPCSRVDFRVHGKAPPRLQGRRE